MKEKVDIQTWQRKKQYTFFSQFTNPYASVSTTINVNNLVLYAKENNISFYGLMSYMVIKSINEIEEFKYVLENGEIYKYNKMNMSFTVLKKDKTLNYTRDVNYSYFEKFIYDFEKAKKEAESDAIIPYSHESNNKVYITCVPWIRFNSVANPQNGIDSNPRVCWGKYFLENNEYKIDISLQVNHAFLDGYHISKFFLNLQDNINMFLEQKNEKEYSLHRSRRYPIKYE